LDTDSVIIYEFPFNERIRSLLRLESLFAKVQAIEVADGKYAGLSLWGVKTAKKPHGRQKKTNYRATSATDETSKHLENKDIAVFLLLNFTTNP
jgi:hypothetical protein